MPAELSLDPTQDGELAQDYQIGPEDVLEILVWKNETLSKTVTVRPDGKLSLPLIGDVQAAGLTTEQVKKAITEKLGQYYKEPPAVSLIVQQAKNYVVYVLGGVQRPGQYVVKSGTTFLHAIALAGGFTPFAETNKILVLRKGENGSTELSMKIRYKDILSGNHQTSNILLRPMDTIIVPN
jgi:polysaccharide export outer membrane protein